MKNKIKKISGIFFNKHRNYKLKRLKEKYKIISQKDSSKNKESEITIKLIKIRNAGIDLGRIISMYFIIIQHILYHGKATQKFNQYKELINLNSFIFCSVSCYIFISGYVGYKSTKYSNLLYLYLCTLFYKIGIALFFIKFKPLIYNRKIERMDFLPFFSDEYWYFTRHFGMYLFLPIINKGLENISKLQLKAGIIIIIGFFIILKDYLIPQYDIFNFNNGYSVIWFLVFYITGAYFGKFKEDKTFFKRIIYSILYIIMFVSPAYLCINLPHYPVKNNGKNFKDKIIIFLKHIFVVRINSFTMILQAISVTLFLTNINYNEYIAKIITFIGPLTFGIYLIHDNNIIRGNLMKHLLDKYPKSLFLNQVCKIIFSKALKIFAICLPIDYIRNILFKKCQIRRICILVEKLIFKLISII